MSGEYVRDLRMILSEWADIAYSQGGFDRRLATAEASLAAHDARIASEAAEKALRDAESDLAEMEHPDLTVVVGDPDDDETWESIPVTDWLRASADRIAAERNAS